MIIIVFKSLSLRRAWIEISSAWANEGHTLSLSLRRAWIEIAQSGAARACAARRSPYGERGLKSEIEGVRVRMIRRSPYGERGLKSCVYRLFAGA